MTWLRYTFLLIVKTSLSNFLLGILNSRTKYATKQKQYKLFAVVYHDGKEASKGHYLTDVFHVGYSSWIRYDDSTVKAVPESQVLRPRAPRVPYLLYYRRFDTIGINNQQNNSSSGLRGPDHHYKDYRHQKK